MIAEPQIQERLYTANELLDISVQDENRYELIQGRLVVTSPAGSEHGDCAMALGAHMYVHAEDHDLGVVLAAETGFYLERNPDTVRAPDASFVAQANLPDGPLPRSYFNGFPDIAVEVVSPNDRAGEVQDKVQDWLSHGTKLVWVVEPKTQTLTIYRADGSAQVLQPTDVLNGEDVLLGFEYSLAKLFRQL